MPQAIAGAVVGAIGLTGTVAAVVGFGVQMAVSYALTSLTTKKPSSAAAVDRKIELTGGLSSEHVIYGRAKVSGTRYMLQKYNGYIYHGIAICRHPCEEIEAIYFDDKLSTHPDFSNVELANYKLTFNNDVTADSDITITVDGIDYTYSATIGETNTDIMDAFAALMPSTSEIEIKKAVSTYKEGSPLYPSDGYATDTININRLTGGVDEWDVSIVVNSGTSGVSIISDLISGHAETEKKFRLLYSLGNHTEADPTLVSELDFEDVPNRWTENHKNLGITWINVRWSSSFLRDNIGRLPAVTVVLKGKNNIYDPRSDSYIYTTNAALVTRDWLTQPYGFDATNDVLNSDTWIAAANVCDEDVIINELDQTQKRYEINTVITTESQPADVLSLFSQSMQAPIGWLGGGWHLKPAKYEIPGIELTVDDLAGNIQFTDRPSIQNRYNQMQGTFVNPLQEWSSHDYPVILVEDGMDTKTGELNLTTEIDYIRAQRLAQLHLLLNYASAPTQIHIKRLNTYISVDSMIYLTVSALNWDKKTFYVANRVDNEDATATLTLLPRQSEMFDWDCTQAQAVDSVTSSPIFDIREELNNV